jgi:tetratricopeptide (TPR) repeat protein
MSKKKAEDPPKKDSSWSLILGAFGLVVLGVLAIKVSTEAPGIEGLAEAKVAFVDRDFERAERILRAHSGAEASALLGRVLLERGRAPEAREAFQTALKAEPDHLEALRGMAQSLQALGQDSLAVGTLQKAVSLEKGKDDARLWRELALAQKKSGDAIGALSSLQRSLALDAKQADVAALVSDIGSGRDAQTLHPALSTAMNPATLQPIPGVPQPGRQDPASSSFLPFQNPSRRPR